jgi:hypothetical protein
MIIDKSYQIYQVTITKSKLSLDKLYKLIINALNEEQNYSINIEYNDNINITLEYHNEMIDIVEEIQLIKQIDIKSTEILLVNKIKELEGMINNLNGENKKLEDKILKFFPDYDNILSITYIFYFEKGPSNQVNTHILLNDEPTNFSNINIKMCTKLNKIIYKFDPKDVGKADILQTYSHGHNFKSRIHHMINKFEDYLIINKIDSVDIIIYSITTIFDNRKYNLISTGKILHPLNSLAPYLNGYKSINIIDQQLVSFIIPSGNTVEHCSADIKAINDFTKAISEYKNIKIKSIFI